MPDVELQSTPRLCAWALKTELDRRYHDCEWGTPLHDDRALFEFLVLEGAQAGLSWSTILARREEYRRAFDCFDAEVVARYGAEKQAELLGNPGIIRNRLKVGSAVKNARAFLAVREEFGSFDAYLWRFVDGSPVINSWLEAAQIPAFTPQSEAMSKDMSRRGFTFVGKTICYAMMQAVGMVNDHLVHCFRWRELGGGE